MHKIIKELQLMDKGHTAREIASQPGLWLETYETVLARKDEIKKFLAPVYQQRDLQIILTGAGSSAFIGEILQYSFHRNTGRSVRAIPTTDLVTHPGDFFQSAIPTLLVSFARSGDSPESIASYELAENMIDQVFHLVITCNPEGKLAAKASAAGNAFFLLLPEGTNDQALAMTSSFTSMTLAGLLVAEIDRIEENRAHVKGLAAAAAGILDKYTAALQGVAGLDFQRIVFLGSGPLKGSAEEAHLKVIELTDGKINCQYDSFLGFRHGPKAIIDASTLLVYLFSNDPHVSQYERDLVASINETEEFLYSIGIRQTGPQSGHLDLEIIPDPAGPPIPDDYLAICSVIPAQLLGLYKSLALGLTPDAPSRNGGIHRVVQGVTIYPTAVPMKKTFDVIVVGELNIDLILNQLGSIPQIGTEKLAGEMSLTLGSSAAIFASNLSALGMQVAFVAKAGNDIFGKFCIDSLQKKGVDTSMIIRSEDLQTGATVVLNFGDDRAMVTHQGAMGHLGPGDITKEMLGKARHLHFSSYFLQPGFTGRLEPLFRLAKEAGLTTSLDVQWDPAERWDLDLLNLLPHVDIFLPNEAELLHLTRQDSIDKALAAIAKDSHLILVKRGRQGSLLHYNNKTSHGAPYLNDKVVDAIGAGDSFNAGFIFKFLQNSPAEECQQFGNAMGAVSTTAAGGTTAFTHYEEILDIAKKEFGYEQ